ncbi:MAG TPA: glycosyltransferase family 2 protein [Synergistales bacterium]|nr:glycosyltransferase family 2 protein [Candidatus Cloacimonadota bacterium]HOI81952.1 glycosyltransferase family 2 protein [Synergistales bacterium]
MVSVIIVTINRSNELREISLPSLLGQDTDNFEVIVWDASNDDLSLGVVREMEPLFRKKGVSLTFQRAPRRGSASQRNDAVKSAKGRIVFFMDDDAEVSPDGIRGLSDCFERYPCVMGAGLVVEEVVDGRNLSEPRSAMEKLKGWFYRLARYKRKRKVYASGSAKGLWAGPGPAEWLSGCSMAFRRQVFDDIRFNEKMETFGPYALGEDIEFSHRVFIKYGEPLRIAEKGMLVHRPSPVSRFSINERYVAARILNRYLTMKASSVRAPVIGRLGYCWFLIKNFVVLSYHYGLRTALQGFVMALGGLYEIRAKGEPAR